MGLLDDPLGFIFGSDGDQGTVDTRSDRTGEGKRYWQRWEEIFGPDGPGDPYQLVERALGELTAPAINIGLDGVTIPAYQNSRIRRAAALMDMVDPWLQGGYLLEQGRKGMGYIQPSNGGLLGNTLDAFATGLGGTVGRGVAGGLGGIFTGQPQSQANNLGQYTRFNYWGQ
ncbi:MAG: hypothetical protein KQH53_08270 [Desulfarculaceae bacterium]|nr:hypothetical protein [Desulfarculaceae bacterium]